MPSLKVDVQVRLFFCLPVEFLLMQQVLEKITSHVQIEEYGQRQVSTLRDRQEILGL